MDNMIKGYRYRLYPTSEQVVFLNKNIGCSRFIYNWGLNKKIESYQTTGRSPSCFDLAKELKNLKKEYEWLSEVGNDSLQYALRNLDNAFQRFFKQKKGFPKFKSKKGNRNGFQTYQGTNIDFINKTIDIPKCKKIPVRIDRIFDGEYTGCRITKVPSGKYYVSFQVDDGKLLPEKPKPDIKKSIGIDLGLKNFATISTGEKISHPKHIYQSQKKLELEQRRLSKKQKGSKNRDKQRIKVARVHERITNQRKDFIHKLSSRLIAENQSIVIEDLSVGNMIKNHNLARSISDSGWYEFRRQLEYKSDWYGKNLITIGRFEPSSKMCTCGAINKELKLSDRIWTCRVCGNTHDRDILASQNILRFGFTGRGTSEEPVEPPNETT